MKEDLGNRRIDAIIKIRNLVVWRNSEARIDLQGGIEKARIDEKRRKKFMELNEVIQSMRLRENKEVQDNKFKQLRSQLLKQCMNHCDLI